MRLTNRRIISMMPLLAVVILFGNSAFAVDGVVEINQACAVNTGCLPGDAPGFPVQINTEYSGSYVLTSDLDITGEPSPPDVTVILVAAPSVTLDMNGFAIRGAVSCAGTPPICDASGTGKGVRATGPRFAIYNGVISGMGSDGVEITGFDSIVERLRLRNNAGDCIAGGQGSIIRNNTMRLCGGNGISAFSASVIEGNSVSFCAGFGINMNDQSSGYVGNVLRANNGSSANPQTSGGLELGPNNCGNSLDCP